MKTLKLLLTILSVTLVQAQEIPDAKTILEKIDKNIVREKATAISTMEITNRRGRVNKIRSQSWINGENASLSEYLSPAREKGTKMLKEGDVLWLYTPAADRVIQISGHMLRQSVSGSDLSYEDMMEDQSLQNTYNATVTGKETINGRECFVLRLEAKTDDVAYPGRKLWVDSERWLPLKEERYAKSGKLLKLFEIREVMNVDGRWYPKVSFFKDMLSNSKGTIYTVEEIKFNVDFPANLFSKASLRQ